MFANTSFAWELNNIYQMVKRKTGGKNGLCNSKFTNNGRLVIVTESSHLLKDYINGTFSKDGKGGLRVVKLLKSCSEI